MRESRLYGFVRGALSNERPYRVSFSLLRCMSPEVALRDILQRRASLVAFGAKRTSARRLCSMTWSKMTQLYGPAVRCKLNRRYAPCRRTLHGFRNGLRISKVIFVGLSERLGVDRRHLPHIVAKG